MSEPTRTELIKALEVVQSYCDATLCNECIFNRPEIKKAKDYCRLCADFPAYWDTAIYELKAEKKCENCANCCPWDGFCGLGFNKEAKEHGVCEWWESK